MGTSSFYVNETNRRQLLPNTMQNVLTARVIPPDDTPILPHFKQHIFGSSAVLLDEPQKGFIRSSGVCLLIIIKIVSSSFLLKRKNINTLSINKQVVI